MRLMHIGATVSALIALAVPCLSRASPNGVGTDVSNLFASTRCSTNADQIGNTNAFFAASPTTGGYGDLFATSTSSGNDNAKAFGVVFFGIVTCALIVEAFDHHSHSNGALQNHPAPVPESSSLVALSTLGLISALSTCRRRWYRPGRDLISP